MWNLKTGRRDERFAFQKLFLIVYEAFWKRIHLQCGRPGLGRSPREGKGCPLQYFVASLVAQLVKNPSAMWETWVQPLGWEDPLEKGKATHSSILAWRIPGTL